MYKTCLLVIGLSWFNCQFCLAQKTEKDTSQNDDSFSKQEEKIIDTIAHLSEVKKRASYIEKQTKGKRHLQYMISAKPTKETPYYTIQVIEDNGAFYYTHFNFYVYPKTLAIHYYDTANDTAISLKQWRKANKE